MDPKTKQLIDDVKAKAMRDQEISRDEIVALLNIPEDSDDCDYLGKAARAVKEKNTLDEVLVGSSIGVDLRPCPMSCGFCSLGAKWGLIDGEYELSEETILELIGGLREKGFYQFALRTTEFYPLEKLIDLAKSIRKKYGNSFGLTVNTGEFGPDEAKKLREAGFTGLYHAIRFGEGTVTPIPPEKRIETIKAAQSAGIKVSVGLDPIGIEHTPEEIADRIMLYKELDPNGVCVMKRINVQGTKYGGVPEISDRKHAQIVAVTRLVGGSRWSVAVHPASMLGFAWGADHMSVETGANPRDNNIDMLDWAPYDHEEALRRLESVGYRLADYGLSAKPSKVEQ